MFLWFWIFTFLVVSISMCEMFLFNWCKSVLCLFKYLSWIVKFVLKKCWRENLVSDIMQNSIVVKKNPIQNSEFMVPKIIHVWTFFVCLWLCHVLWYWIHKPLMSDIHCTKSLYIIFVYGIPWKCNTHVWFTQQLLNRTCI